MATPTIPNGEEYFFTTLYEGNGGAQRVGKFVPFTDNGTIANSVIFNVADNPYLSRTQDTGDSTQKATFSWWFKRGDSLGSETVIIAGGASSRFLVRFDTSNRLTFRLTNGSTEHTLTTNRSFEDTSKWYHCLWQIDATQGTPADRSRVWVDGDEQTFTGTDYPDEDTAIVGLADATTQTIGCLSHSLGTQDWDGYLAEFNYCDNQIVDVSTFGLTDTSTGRWIPKTLSGITYGTNGFRLTFSDNSTASALGTDLSGNSNTFSVNGIDTVDQTTDSPTQNHATIDVNTASNGSMSFSEGNLKVEMNNAYPGNVLGTLGARSGKYYWEVTISGTGSSANGYATGVGVAEWSKLNTDPGGVSTPFSSYIDSRSIFVHNGSSVSNSTTFTAGDVISIALNLDDSEISYFKNDNIVGSAQPLVEGQAYFPLFKNSTGVADLRYTPNFGQKSWNYTPPTGFVALQQDNLPETAKGISGLVWIKNRDASDDHQLYDSSRGKQLVLESNQTTQENTISDGLQKFLKGGQQIEDNDLINTSGESYVSWNWVANGGVTESNDASATGVGDIDSVYQANTTSGFSIVTYTGTGSPGFVKHGLSQELEWFMVKKRSGSQSWAVYHHKNTDAPETQKLTLNTNAASVDDTPWDDTKPTNTAPFLFKVNNAGATNATGQTYVAYCWHSVDGFSKFGRYVGNGPSSGSAGTRDGTFVYTGFRPAYLMVKALTQQNWVIYDSTRSPINPISVFLAADGTNSTITTAERRADFLSNGFKMRGNNGATNGNGTTYIYMAFAKCPFANVSPATAR